MWQNKALRQKLTPEQSAIRFRRTKLQFKIYIIMLTVLAGFFAVMAGNSLYDEHLRRSPGTQTITATVISYKHVCNRGGCGYDSFGNYTINGKSERDVRLTSMTKVPVQGQLGVLVNPARAGLAMSIYHDPFPAEAIWFGACTLFVVALGTTVILLRRRWNKKLQHIIPSQLK